MLRSVHRKMLPRCRSIYGKLIIFTLVLLCFILYIRVLQIGEGNEHFEHHQKHSAAAYQQYEQEEEQQQEQPKHHPRNPARNLRRKNVEVIENNFVVPELANEPSPYELSIKLDLEKQEPGLGNNGKAVYLHGPAKDRADEIYAKIALNEELSERLSYNRTLADTRNPTCLTQHFNLDTLPTASIVIIFYNEPYSVLLRTVHSALITCNSKLLNQIILVDDGSTNIELHGKLDHYVKTRLPEGKVQILRLKDRAGLIRARLAGARLATGDVLIFLDAHCEANIGWFEPLLQRIKESRTSVLVPIIDVIDAKDFHYSTNGYKTFQVGGFQWSGHFDWVNVPEREKERQKRECNLKREICPTYSPTMAGGLFAIDRRYFWEIGSYDEQMDGWGGENLEMSFRIWQCGGTIETIPCSRVGHVFRDFHPYKFPKGRDTHGINTARMALVWMDDYVNIFFLNRPDLKNNPDIGDITHRVMLRKKLRCKSFDWYLNNIYPEKYVPTKNVIAFGRIKSTFTNICLDDLSQNNEKPYNLGLYGCGKKFSKSQFFSLTNNGVLRNEISCATVQYTKTPPHLVVMTECMDKDEYNEEWKYTNRHLMHVPSRLCLDHAGLRGMDHVEVRKCDEQSETQQWVIEHD